MAKISGKNGKVMYGSVVVAEQVSWSMSGVTMPTTKAPTAFGDTGMAVKEITDLPDAGTLEFNGNWDPSNATQKALHTACAAGTHLTNLYLYANTSTFWRVGTGGYIIVTKSQAAHAAAPEGLVRPLRGRRSGHPLHPHTRVRL